MWVYGWGDLPGQLVVVSGPSGSGKSTIIRELLASGQLDAELSVSATTRPPRVGERDGIDYHFLSADEFRAGIERQEFLEFAQYNNHFYGTPAGPVRKALESGRCVLLEIEAQGASQVRKKAPEALFVFIDVPTFRDLAKRLRARGSESEEQIHNRLVIARDERDQAYRYDVRIVNDNLAAAVNQLATVVKEYSRAGGH